MKKGQDKIQLENQSTRSNKNLSENGEQNITLVESKNFPETKLMLPI